MANTESIEETIKSQVQIVHELQMATVFLQNKDGLMDALLEAKQDIEIIKKGILGLGQTLERMKTQNDVCKQLTTLFCDLDKDIVHMSNNIPDSLLDHLVKSQKPQEGKTPKLKDPKAPEAKPDSLEAEASLVTSDMMVEPVKDCRKALFREAEDSYSIDALSENEFAKIPKYMIGRQTLATVNAFVGIINQIMKAKYGLLSLGKNGARKKGELDLYLQFKKEESDVKGSGNEKIYFFTADDYHRETKLKLDKTKLNLLTVLRHCKRIHELRSGKNVRYQTISSL